MTKFSYEVPLAHMEDFEEFQDYQFILSFLCKNYRYVKHIKDSKKRVVLDNSFNELKVPDDVGYLIDLYHDLQADKIVCPDCDGWLLKDLEKAYWELESQVPQEDILVVVKNEEEFKWCQDEHIPLYCTAYRQRSELTDHMLYYSYHFLGLCNTWEIRKYMPFSCDTSMPIKLALEGMTMASWEIQGFPHIHTEPEFFYLKLTRQQIALAKDNMQWMKQNL